MQEADDSTNVIDGNDFTNETRWQRVKRFASEKRYFLIALGVILAAGGGALTYMLTRPAPKPATYEVTRPKPKEEPKFYSPLTGVEVVNETATKRTVTAIMIENSPDARPQSGLRDAGLVYEAVAEGGITRFIALYQETRPGLIGPVRSVRPYYVEWAAAYDPAVAHIGGSARALNMIRSGKYGVDLDQFFNAGTYWRATDRYAPHNVYTNFDRLDALNKDKKKTESRFTPIPRVDGKPVEKPDAVSIDIGVSSGAYAVSYKYDKKANDYLRYQGGEPHRDREKGQIKADTVVAIKVPMSLGFEDGYREQIKTTGKGQAFIFQNGTAIKATWSKSGPKDQIEFTDADGKPVSLVRGKTWITALASDRGVSWR